MFCISLAPIDSLEVQHNIGFSLLDCKLLIGQVLEMDASASDFSAHNTYFRHGPHVPSHRAVRQCPSSFTCIILSCYNTFVLSEVTLAFIAMDQTGINPCDSDIKCSALSGQFVTFILFPFSECEGRVCDECF